MAEFGPDAELAARLQAMEESMAKLEQAGRPLQRFRVPYRAAAEQSRARSRLEAEYADAAERAERARDSYVRGVEQHPAAQYRQILEEADGVKAPELSGWEWFKQNPSLLEAVPKTDKERTQDARTAFILRRVGDAAAKSVGGPFAWSGYGGPGSDAIQAATEAAGAYASGPRVRVAMESPYHYQPYSLLDDNGEMLPVMGDPVYPEAYGDSLTGSPLADRVLANAYRPVSALWGGAGRFHDNFVSGGAAVSEGRLSDAAKAFGYAVPNLVSPSFHVGGPGMEDDWRGYVKPGEAAAMDLAADVPWWFTRGVYRSRPGRGLTVAGAEDRIRQYRDELLGPLMRKAAQRHHPDVGGSLDAMKRVNEAFATGDVDTLRRMAQ